MIKLAQRLLQVSEFSQLWKIQLECRLDVVHGSYLNLTIYHWSFFNCNVHVLKNVHNQGLIKISVPDAKPTAIHWFGILIWEFHKFYSLSIAIQLFRIFKELQMNWFIFKRSNAFSWVAVVIFILIKKLKFLYFPVSRKKIINIIRRNTQREIRKLNFGNLGWLLHLILRLDLTNFLV